MASDNNLQFIREKIYEIRNAFMYSMSNGLVKIPNNILYVVKVDEDGQLWFVCTAPAQRVEECEAVFPARLLFYKKGKFFHIEVSGKATIVKDSQQTDTSLPASNDDSAQPVLLKMSMMNVEYTSAAENRQKGKLEVMLENGYKWMLRNLAIPRHEKSVFSKLHQTHMS